MDPKFMPNDLAPPPPPRIAQFETYQGGRYALKFKVDALQSILRRQCEAPVVEGDPAERAETDFQANMPVTKILHKQDVRVFPGPRPEYSIAQSKHYSAKYSKGCVCVWCIYVQMCKILRLKCAHFTSKCAKLSH